MIFSLLLYLLFSVPILIFLVSWRITGDGKSGWRLPADKRDRFLWLVAGFAIAFPLFLSGLGCSLFNLGIYATSTLGRMTGAVHSENYDIFFLLALAVSVPAGLIGFFCARAAWRRLRGLLLNQVASKSEADNDI